MIRNFIYELDTGVILSLHATNTGCSEALSSHYSGKPSDYPNDRAWEQRKFPQLCKPEDIIGTKLDDCVVCTICLHKLNIRLHNLHNKSA